MKVGFTGTREGMTAEQRQAVRRWLERQGPPAEFHHGCCVGADAAAAGLADQLGVSRIVGYPCDIWRLQSNIALGLCHEVRDPLPPLDRNRDIVDACEVLLACPGGPEQMRSGTWATVRFARKCGRRVVIVWPDGSLTEEGGAQ